MHLENKVVIVSGAASGIGLAVVKELFKYCVKGVSVLDINEKNGLYEVDKLREKFGKDKVLFIKTDITKEKEFDEAFQKTIDYFNQVDILINNAAILDEEDFTTTITTNFIGTTRGTFLGMKYLHKNINGKGGIIINIASVAAMCKLHRYTAPIYSATKAAIVKLSQGLGNAFHVEKTGVKIMVVCPGGTLTPLYLNSKFLEGCKEECAMQYIYMKKEMQLPETIARSITYVIINGETESTWLVEDNNLYSLEDIDILNECKTLEVQNI